MTDDRTKAQPALLTVREVAQMLRVSTNCVYDLVAKGKLCCYRVGVGRGAIRVRQEDVSAYLAGCRREPSDEAPAMPRRRLKHLTL